MMCFLQLGRASIYIMRTAFGVDWSERIKIIYAGDDATDEDAMVVCIQFNRAHQKLATSKSSHFNVSFHLFVSQRL